MQEFGGCRPPAQFRPERPIRLDHCPPALRQKLLEKPLRLHLHVEHAARRQLRLTAGEIGLQDGEGSRARGPFGPGHKRQEMHKPAGKHAVIAHEVDHLEPRLARGRPQAAAELLQKHDL